MKHLENWNIYRSKEWNIYNRHKEPDREVRMVEQYGGYRIGDWVYLNKKVFIYGVSASPFSTNVAIIRTISVVTENYTEVHVFVDVETSRNEISTIDFENIKRKLTSKEIKDEKLKLDASKYNL